jgi:hypothetical protein
LTKPSYFKVVSADQMALVAVARLSSAAC